MRQQPDIGIGNPTLNAATAGSVPIDGNNVDDDLMDLFMYYVDDLCDERIEELNATIKFYGLISCGITIVFVFTGLLFLSVWIFTLINKGGSDNEIEDDCKGDVLEDYMFEHSFTPPLEAKSIRPVNEVYISKWDLPRRIKDKALFWRSTSKQITNPDYSGYDSVIDLYANETSRTSVSNGIDDESTIPFDEFSKTLPLELKGCNISDGFTTATARSVSNPGSIQQSPNIEFTASTPDWDDISETSLENPLVFQNISLLDDDDENENEGEQDIRDDIKMSIQKSKILSDEDDSLDTKVSNDDVEINKSNYYSYQISIFGPSYLSIYLEKVYGNWNEFEKRVMISERQDGFEEEEIKDKAVRKALKVVNRKNVEDFKKEKIKTRLAVLRVAYITETYHEIILNDILKNVDFLFRVIKSDKVASNVKSEIIQLFYCSFWYESKILLTFEFAEKVIECLIEFLSFVSKGCEEYDDGIRSLYDFLSYSNIEDFINGGIFDECFRDINNYTFKKQNIIWECLKLVICQWMNEVKDVKCIYDALTLKVGKLIRKYVEKDNDKYQEFLLIWKMLQERARNEDETKENVVKCGVKNLLRGDKKNVESICKIKRKLSVANRVV